MTDLLSPYLDKDGRITRFDITEDEVRSGMKQGMDIARARVAQIKKESNPDFENTITALESCDEEMSFITGIFFNMLSVMSTDARQALAQEIGPVLSAFRNELTLDAELFAKVDAIYQRRESLKLSAEESMLLENTWLGFVRNGAKLDAEGQARLKEIDARLSQLSPQYSDNVLKSTNEFILWCDEKDVKGLPETALAQARDTAKAKGGKKDYAITLHAPSLGPALTYLDDRAIREKLWRASANIAFQGDNNNSAIVLEIVKLRDKRAKLLGFANHASYVLDRRMAKTAQRVKEFVDDLVKVAKPKAEIELQELKEFAGLDELKPWDIGYHSEKLRQARFNFSAEDFRPYFPLQHALEGTFKHFEKLFGVQFRPVDLPVWHEEVQSFAVTDAKTNEELGILYADFFPRESKRSGAWQSDFRGAGLFRGEVQRPIVSIVGNFTKPAEGKPSLLTFYEVETLFHEMGHAMHNLLAQGRHPSVTGTNVLWDFVELPSQIQENWLMEDETLELVAKHYQTGEKLPHALIEKMRAAQTFQSGLFNLRQLSLGTIDYAWHTVDIEKVKDVLSFEREVTEHLSLMPYIDGCRSTSFGHIFAGGYSAGYYSYLWAEVLDADAFELFKEKGLYDQATASSYRKNILEKGGSEDPMKLYVAFRGREPDPKAMLKRKGLLESRDAA